MYVGRQLWLQSDPLNWEPPCAMGEALKKTKRKKEYIYNLCMTESLCSIAEIGTTQ